MELARYGRQNLLQWDNIEVNEIRRHWYRLRSLVEKENALQTVQEDE